MLTKAQALRLLDAPLQPDPVRFMKSGKPDRRIRTCRQFAAAQRDGFDPATNFDNKISGFFEEACGVLRAVIVARKARRSVIDSPRLGVSSTAWLSSAVLPAFPWESIPTAQERAQRARRSVATFVREEQCTVTEATAVLLRLHCAADMLVEVKELLRADVDGDGFEEIVVTAGIASLTGTFSYTAPDAVLTKTTARALLTPHPIP